MAKTSILLVMVFFLLFTKQALASLYLSSPSSTVINSADEIIIVKASYSGTLTSKQYLQAAIRKIGETYYFGQTQNRRGEWIHYQSVDTADFPNYSQNFFDFQATGSGWLGELKIKLDTESPNFKGPGTYLLKLFRYITAGKNEPDNSLEIIVNVASVSAKESDPVSSSQTTVPSPKIDWTLEDKIYVGRDFKTTKLELSNFEINTEYFLKLRAGTEEGKLTKIQTKNGSAYLSDGESWSEFPLIKTDEKAKWTGEIKGLLTEGKPEGKYKILLRIRKKDTESFYESDIKELNFIKVADEVIIFATPAAATKSVSLKVDVATKSAAAVVMASPSAKQAVLGTKTQKTLDPIPIVLIVTGVIFSAASVALFLEGKGIYDIIRRILKKS